MVLLCIIYSTTYKVYKVRFSQVTKLQSNVEKPGMTEKTQIIWTLQLWCKRVRKQAIWLNTYSLLDYSVIALFDRILQFPET